MQMRYRPLFAHLRPIPLTNRPDLPKGEGLLGDKNKEPFSLILTFGAVTQGLTHTRGGRKWIPARTIRDRVLPPGAHACACICKFTSPTG